MKELLQNIMYAGIGAATLTKEKLEELRRFGETLSGNTLSIR